MKSIELLGLPGVGKSYLLKNSSGNTYFIGSSGIYLRLLHLFVGLLHYRMFIANLFFKRLHQRCSVRPVLVLAERLGMRLCVDKDNTVFEEGVIQFIWRSCCELEKDDKLFNFIVEFLARNPVEFHYVRCAREIHLHRILARGKKQRFDNGVLDGSFKAYYEGRDTMAFVLKATRTAGMKPSGSTST